MGASEATGQWPTLEGTVRLSWVIALVSALLVGGVLLYVAVSHRREDQYRVVKVEVRDRDVASRLYPEDTPTCWITVHHDHLTILAEHVSSGVICDISVGDTVEVYSGDPQYLVKAGHPEEAHLSTYSPKYMYFIESEEER
jgi:hypothetical protein